MRKTVKTYERKTKNADQALASLMRLCARSEKSTGDAQRLMRTWGVPESDRDSVLKKLTTDKFIDDRRYASMFVREKINLSGWGIYKIRQALRNKGVAEPVIAEALADNADKEKMDVRLRDKLASKLNKTAGTPYEIKGKLMRYGLSLGYDYESVTTVVDEIIKE